MATAKAAIAEGQAVDGWPEGEPISIVVTVRPDGHGRCWAIAYDLLGAVSDEWENEELVLRRCDPGER